MGTSGSYGGAGNRSPLIPSFLNDPAPASAPVLPGPSAPPAPGPTVPGPAAPGPQTPAPPSPRPATSPSSPGSGSPPAQAPLPNRFTSPRTNFSRFARSGGSDCASLGRALAGYVSTAAGGSRQATRRMGASRGAGARLYSFLTDAQARGLTEALRALNLQALSGRPLQEVFLGIAEYVCPIGGTVDEGIARDAFVETIADLADQGIVDFDTMTPAQMQTTFEMFVTNTIEARIYNDIGCNGIALPSDVAAVERVQDQLHDFISRAVGDALADTANAASPLTQQDALRHVDTVYEAAFDMLQTLAEGESET